MFTTFLLPKVRLKQIDMDKNGIFSKWLIIGFDGYCFGSDKELYRLSFRSGKNHFGIRKLKKQNPNRWKINGKWWSERQLKDKIILNRNPELIVSCIDMPF